MSTRRTKIAAGIIVIGVAAGGVVAASAQDGQDPGEPTTLDLTATQAEALEAVRTDSPIPVQDQTGRVRGFVHDSDLTARDARVTDQIIAGFRERAEADDPEYDQLYEALRILDPVTVVDDAGATVGYWTHNFKEPSELKALEPEARATADRLLPDRAGD